MRKHETLSLRASLLSSFSSYLELCFFSISIAAVYTPEKSFGSRGKKRTGKFTKQKSSVSQKSSRPLLPTQNEVPQETETVEMIDEAIQTEVVIPEKTEAEIAAEAAAVRRVSVSFIPEEDIKDFDPNDKDVNWVRNSNSNTFFPVHIVLEFLSDISEKGPLFPLEYQKRFNI